MTNIKNLLINLFLFLTVVAYIVIINYSSEKTSKKNFYLVKDGDPSYIKSVDVLNNAIINQNTVRDFSKKAILKLYNYEAAKAITKLEDSEILFTKQSFNEYSEIFNHVLNDEIKNGILIKESVVVGGPYYLGEFKYLDEVAFKVYLKVLETTYGLSGNISDNDKHIFMILKKESFRNNGKGLSIDNIVIN